MLLLYRLFSLLATPPLIILLLNRRRRGKEHATRLSERWGKASLPRPQGTVIWLHAASVGEAQSSLPLIRTLLDRLPAAHVLLTTGTVTSEQLVQAKLPPRAFHQFAPIDSWPAVSRFLRHWKPGLGIWVESELWPNMVLMTTATGCPTALINARMSQKSYRFWRRFPRSIARLLGCFSRICAQSGDDAARLEQLGARNVRMLGNLKLDADPLPDQPETRQTLQAAIGNRPVWLAASTHPGEEMLAGEIHKALKNQHPDLLTLIAPRHPLRGETIVKELQAAGFSTALRSAEEPITAHTDIYIADTIGELGLFYRLADLVFMGGSLVPHGGQNPLEAARLHSTLLVGPHTHNFTAIVESMEQAGALIRVDSATALTLALAHLLAHPEASRIHAEAAFSYATAQSGAVNAVCEALLPLASKERNMP